VFLPQAERSQLHLLFFVLLRFGPDLFGSVFIRARSFLTLSTLNKVLGRDDIICFAQLPPSLPFHWRGIVFEETAENVFLNLSRFHVPTIEHRGSDVDDFVGVLREELRFESG
jgi:hypothetical protein